MTKISHGHIMFCFRAPQALRRRSFLTVLLTLKCMYVSFAESFKDAKLRALAGDVNMFHKHTLPSDIDVFTLELQKKFTF